MKKAIVLGGGFAGCTAANFLKKKGHDVIVIEKSNFLGGGCRTFFYHGHPYTFGPHHLLVNVDESHVYDYYSNYLEFRELEHFNMTYVGEDQRFYTYPIHRDEVDLMPDADVIREELANLPDSGEAKNFEEYWQWSVGETLYNKFINRYSKKMWGVKNNQSLDEFTFSFKNKREDGLKTGSKKCFDGKKRVYYPVNLNGYNDYFDACVEGCEVRLDTELKEFDIPNKRVKVEGEWLQGDVIVNTLSPDMLFDYKYGELPYMGREFIKVILPVESVTPDPYFFIHYAGDEEYTRIFEYKRLTGYVSDSTLIVIEKPSRKNKLYPYPVMSEINRAKKYISEMPEGVYSIGRMGNYHYDNMDVVINHCFDLFGGIDGIVK